MQGLLHREREAARLRRPGRSGARRAPARDPPGSARRPRRCAHWSESRSTRRPERRGSSRATGVARRSRPAPRSSARPRRTRRPRRRRETRPDVSGRARGAARSSAPRRPGAPARDRSRCRFVRSGGRRSPTRHQVPPRGDTPSESQSDRARASSGRRAGAGNPGWWRARAGRAGFPAGARPGPEAGRAVAARRALPPSRLP